MALQGFQDSKKQADLHFNKAETELGKYHMDPEKTCQSCRSSMIDYMNAFLLKNEVEPRSLQTISILLEQCKEVDKDFENVDMTSINCKYELIHRDPCTSHVKLQQCFDTTSAIRDLSRK